MINQIKAAIADLFPGYFALVMSTGIISISCFYLGMDSLSRGLFLGNQVFYVVLACLLILRAIFYPGRVFEDIQDYGRGFGFRYRCY